MNTETELNTTETWCLKQAAVVQTISQEQMNAVLWALGHPVGQVTSWTPAKMQKFYQISAEGRDYRLS